MLVNKKNQPKKKFGTIFSYFFSNYLKDHPHETNDMKKIALVWKNMTLLEKEKYYSEYKKLNSEFKDEKMQQIKKEKELKKKMKKKNQEKEEPQNEVKFNNHQNDPKNESKKKFQVEDAHFEDDGKAQGDDERDIKVVRKGANRNELKDAQSPKLAEGNANRAPFVVDISSIRGSSSSKVLGGPNSIVIPPGNSFNSSNFFYNH